MLSNPSLGKISITLQYSSQSDKYLPGTRSKILIPVGAGLCARLYSQNLIYSLNQGFHPEYFAGCRS